MNSLAQLQGLVYDPFIMEGLVFPLAAFVGIEDIISDILRHHFFRGKSCVALDDSLLKVAILCLLYTSSFLGCVLLSYPLLTAMLRDGAMLRTCSR